MSFVDHTRLAEDLLPVVLHAAAIEMSYFGVGVMVLRKTDRSPVTAADQEAERTLLAGLAKIAPGIPVVAEERVAAGDIPEIGETFFLVDPLDGTREFIRNGREFTINVGLVTAGNPIFGLIYAPALGRLFVTTGPRLAVEAEIAPTTAAVRLSPGFGTPLRTAEPDPSGLVIIESRSRPSPALATILKRHQVRERRRAASSLKFGLVAAGEADVYAQFGETSEWDTAAGEAILVAAGGSVSDLDGRPLAYGKANRGFANPAFLAWRRPPTGGW